MKIIIHPGTATRAEIARLIEEMDKLRRMMIEESGADIQPIVFDVRWSESGHADEP